MTIKDIKKGEYFTLKNIENPKESQVYIKGEYDKTEKAYECQKFSDISIYRYFKANKEVFTQLIF